MEQKQDVNLDEQVRHFNKFTDLLDLVSKKSLSKFSLIDLKNKLLIYSPDDLENLINFASEQINHEHHYNDYSVNYHQKTFLLGALLSYQRQISPRKNINYDNLPNHSLDFLFNNLGELGPVSGEIYLKKPVGDSLFFNGISGTIKCFDEVGQDIGANLGYILHNEETIPKIYLYGYYANFGDIKNADIYLQREAKETFENNLNKPKNSEIIRLNPTKIYLKVRTKVPYINH